MDALDPVQFWGGVGGILAAVSGAVAYVHVRIGRVGDAVKDLKLHSQKAREAQRLNLETALRDALEEHRKESDLRYPSLAAVARIETDMGWVRSSLERIERAVGVQSGVVQRSGGK